MDPFVKKAVSNGTPVIALINDVLAPEIQAKSLISFHEIGNKVGEFIIHDSKGKDIKLCFFAGPQGAGWSSEMYEGFKTALFTLKKREQKITFPESSYGDTRPEVQRLRLDFLLNKPENYQMDYLVCNAVAEAVGYLEKHRKNHPQAKIVSTYITIDTYEAIKAGKIIAAPNLETLSQSKMALDMMIRLLNGEKPGKDFPFEVSPIIHMIYCTSE